eukprot:TRINITY_DN1779_c0_g1_i1.p1 TRINITY_DN1779_c0_g1~~TRINITY_DN1779_c0_g1_i1.p1  ORF type:complete len:678 (-),score=87.78 TRINITY_DN1779_c0_g1_i1:487-2244(-)
MNQRIREEKESGKLVSGIDKEFLDHVVSNIYQYPVILDGFPRSQDQVLVLIDYAQRYDWNIIYITIELPESSLIEISITRQYLRDVSERKPVDMNRYIGKVIRSFTEDDPAMKMLATALHEDNILRLNGGDNAEQMSKSVRNMLGLDIQSLDWDKETLKRIRDVSTDLDIEAWVIGGGVTRVFWNDTFGPKQISTDVDIMILDQLDTVKFQEEIERRYPKYRRWSVHGAVLLNPSSKKYILETEKSKLMDSIMNVPLKYRCGGVRLDENNNVVLKLGPGVEGDLRRGILRMNDNESTETLLDIRSIFPKVMDECVGRTRKNILEYPGLKITGLLESEYVDRHSYHIPSIIYTDWKEMMDATKEMEKTIKKDTKNNEWMSTTSSMWYSEQDAEFKKTFTEKLKYFEYSFENTKKEPKYVPRCEQSRLPGNLQQLVEISKKEDMGLILTKEEDELLGSESIELPDDKFSCWSSYVFYRCPDNEFKEWILNQTRSRNPKGGKDQFLHTVLSLKFLGSYPDKCLNTIQIQKPIHSGWTVIQHIKESLLQLETDKLMNELTERNIQSVDEIRCGVRISRLDVKSCLILIF